MNFQNTKTFQSRYSDITKPLQFKLILLYPTVNKLLKIPNISDLTFLCNSHLSFFLIIWFYFLNRIKDTKKKDQTRNEGPSSSLASSTMSSHYKLWIIQKSYGYIKSHFQKSCHFNRLMITPRNSYNIPIKKLMVIMMVPKIDNQKMVSMSFSEKPWNIFNRIFIYLFNTLSG